MWLPTLFSTFGSIVVCFHAFRFLYNYCFPLVCFFFVSLFFIGLKFKPLRPLVTYSPYYHLTFSSTSLLGLLMKPFLICVCVSSVCDESKAAFSNFVSWMLSRDLLPRYFICVRCFIRYWIVNIKILFRERRLAALFAVSALLAVGVEFPEPLLSVSCYESSPPLPVMLYLCAVRVHMLHTFAIFPLWRCNSVTECYLYRNSPGGSIFNPLTCINMETEKKSIVE